MSKPKLEQRYLRTDGPIHTFFQLSYASYLIIPRSHLQLMPVQWQEQLVALLEQLPDNNSEYDVRKRDRADRFLYDEASEYRHPSEAHTRRLERQIVEKGEVIIDPIAEALLGLAIVRGASAREIRRMRVMIDRYYAELQW